AQVDGTRRSAGQLHVAAAVPKGGGAILRTRIRIEAVLDLELGRQAAAEVLVAAEAKARGGRLLHGPGITSRAARVDRAGAAIVALGDAHVEHTVDRHRRLRRSRASESAQNCESEQRFF